VNKDLVTKLPATLLAAIKATSDKHVVAPFHHEKTTIWSVVEAPNLSLVDVMPAIVRRARTQITPRKKAKAEKTSYFYTPPAALKTELEQYLYARTGIAFHFKFPTKKGGKEVNEKKIVDTGAKAQSLKVEVSYLHLPFLEDRAGKAARTLWEKAIKNTFGAKQGDELEKYIAAARLDLARAGPRPDIWSTKKFEFSTGTRNRIERLIKLLEANPWPSPKQYAEPKASAVKEDTLLGKKVTAKSVRSIGLRLGNYLDWGPGQKTNKADGRDAHHITQFLLFEYLHNAQRSYKPFPHLDQKKPDLYPGVTPMAPEPGSKAASAKTIEGATSSKRIAAFDYFEDRGGLMPTIYITKHTHLSGIHFRAERPDEGEGDTLRATQGASIHNVFTARMEDYAGVLKEPKQLAALAKATSDKQPVEVKKGLRLSQSDLRTRIFTAAVKSYQSMRDEMQPKLRRALETSEVQYYNAVVRLKKKSDLKGDKEMLTTKAVDRVFAAAVKANENELEDAGKAGFKP
jgi:hypothetical protein